MLGLTGREVHQSSSGWSPVWVTDGLGVMSIGFMLPQQDNAVIWRGPKKNGLIKQFLTVRCRGSCARPLRGMYSAYISMIFWRQKKVERVYHVCNPPSVCISILLGFCKDKVLATGQLDLSHKFNTTYVLEMGKRLKPY